MYSKGGGRAAGASLMEPINHEFMGLRGLLSTRGGRKISRSNRKVGSTKLESCGPFERETSLLGAGRGRAEE